MDGGASTDSLEGNQGSAAPTRIGGSRIQPLVYAGPSGLADLGEIRRDENG
ncbi:hypothetical protein [Bradyrhizobium sp. UFLA05-112]